jgi:hypothetical protein
LQAIDTREALKALGARYPAVFNDPDLATIAGFRVTQLAHAYQSAGIAKPTFEVWCEAVQSVQDRFTGSREAPAGEPAALSARPDDDVQGVPLNDDKPIRRRRPVRDDTDLRVIPSEHYLEDDGTGERDGQQIELERQRGSVVERIMAERRRGF